MMRSTRPVEVVVNSMSYTPRTGAIRAAVCVAVRLITRQGLVAASVMPEELVRLKIVLSDLWLVLPCIAAVKPEDRFRWELSAANRLSDNVKVAPC